MLHVSDNNSCCLHRFIGNCFLKIRKEIAEKEEYVRIIRAVTNLVSVSLRTAKKSEKNITSRKIIDNLVEFGKNQKKLSLRDIRIIRSNLERK